MINKYKIFYFSNNILIILLFLITLFIISCDDTAQQIYDYEFPTEGEISFQNHVQPFIKLRCSTSQCHGDNTQAGNRRITDYFSYFQGLNAGGLVVVSEPETSLLLQVIDGRNPHLSNMRLVPARENQINGIRSWIKAGALNN